MIRPVATATAALLLSACQPSGEQRMRGAFQGAGLPDPIAHCLADRISDKFRSADWELFPRTDYRPSFGLPPGAVTTIDAMLAFTAGRLDPRLQARLAEVSQFCRRFEAGASRRPRR